MKHRAFLFVLSEPGSQVTQDEFDDWYDNEHVPLRLEHLPEFLTGVRYEALDGKKPGWAAAYEISDPILFSQSKYTNLRANRSPREADLVARLETLDRRTYTSVLYDSAGNDPPRGAQNASSLVITITSDHHPVDPEKWNDVPSWRRTSTYKLGDSLLIGHGKEPKANATPQYLTVVELSNFSAGLEHSELYRHTKEHAVELRTWQLHKAWDNTSGQ